MEMLVKEWETVSCVNMSKNVSTACFVVTDIDNSMETSKNLAISLLTNSQCVNWKRIKKDIVSSRLTISRRPKFYSHIDVRGGKPQFGV